jgi:hypothetical protein
MQGMTFCEIESFLRCVALPPFKLGVRTRLIEECLNDSALRAAAANEAADLLRVRGEMAREGWWN